MCREIKYIFYIAIILRKKNYSHECNKITAIFFSSFTVARICFFDLAVVYHRLRSNGLRTVDVRRLRLSCLGKYIRLADRMLLHRHDPRYGDLQNQHHTRNLRSSEYFVSIIKWII